MGRWGYRVPLETAFRRFDSQLIEIEHVVRTIQWLNRNRDAIHSALSEQDGKSSLAGEFMSQWERDPALLSLKTFDIRSVALCLSVDRFQSVLSSFLQEIFTYHPDTLDRVMGEVSVQDVLRCGSMDAFRVWLANREVRRLKQFERIRRFVAQLGVRVSISKKTRDLTAFAIACRNALVHNSGIADDESVRLAPPGRLSRGQQVRCDDATLWECVDALREAADAFQKAIGAKFFGRGRSLLPSHHAAFARRLI